jgi:3'-phosphoadenosine 5'-phosphosulfate sulfotransferase (PAPS reductase)/FAD synthetase
MNKPTMHIATGIAVEIIEDAIEEFKPQWVFGLFSGGHDSLTACYIASLAPKFDGCIHINTGIGIPATRQFVIDTCQQHGWPLKEYKATENTKADGSPDPQNYDEVVLKHGFPGPFAHRMMYTKLKERQLLRLAREHEGRILFVSGVRQQESERRMRHTQVFQKEGRRAWVAPIWDWSKSDCSNLMEQEGLKRNEIVDLIHKSGECLCGAFAKKGELEELKLWPQTRPAYDRIKALEQKVKDAGLPWGWEAAGPPEWFTEKKRGQEFMLDYDSPQHLCWSCTKGETK